MGKYGIISELEDQMARPRVRGEVEMIGIGKLWAAVIEQGKGDLRSSHPRTALAAAIYFFVDGQSTDLREFSGLCLAVGIDSDCAAEAIWRQLKIEQQTKIACMLRRAGYGDQITIH